MQDNKQQMAIIGIRHTLGVYVVREWNFIWLSFPNVNGEWAGKKDQLQ